MRLSEPIGGYVLVKMTDAAGAAGWGEAPAIRITATAALRAGAAGVRRATSWRWARVGLANGAGTG